MLSILISVYNFNINDLIDELIIQAKSLAIEFEIIVIDDASTDQSIVEANRLIIHHPNLSLSENKKNMGRSAARNLLAQKAKYNYILFMDGDSRVSNPNFLANYISYCKSQPQNLVICGGTAYNPIPPNNHNLYLRWFYGINREQRKAADRNKNPNASFSAFNFLISKDLFEQIKFDESLVKYGHEDTLLGYAMKKMGIAIKHIDNPLFHIGLEENGRFINKTIEGIENLKHIYHRFNSTPDFIEDIKLLNTYLRMRKMRFVLIIRLLYKVFRGLIYHNLKGPHPSMFCFGLLKIGYLCSIKDAIENH